MTISKAQNAQQIIAEAERICCLGFSYHELNLARLRLPEVLKRRLIGEPRAREGMGNDVRNVYL